jgi:single-stranded DNA-binding protein
MSKIGVRLKIDVSKIDKARLFRGQKGVYLDATVFIDPDQKDQYENNGMITQDVTKKEKDSGVKAPILGNVQVFWKEQYQQQAPQQQAPQQQAPQQQAPDNFDDQDIPF